MMNRLICILLVTHLLPGVLQASSWAEPPFFAEQVAAGKLPTVGQRLPNEPSVARLNSDYQTPGEYGGSMRMLMAKSKDIRMMMVYGYARLVAYNEKLELVPDLIKSLDNDGNKSFTFHLLPGHRWSDGTPFTSEAFRYFWEQVATNDQLSKFGPPNTLVLDGELPKVEILDELTVRYSWSRPNPYFLPALAAPRPLFIYRAGHYLKQFHADFVDKETLDKLVDEYGVRNWAGLHLRKDHNYKFDNPDLPTLQPWRATTFPPSEQFVFERNPYYHRVDDKGKQLPYIDKVIVNIVSKDLIPAKTGSGESDLQGRYLRLDNFTFLKAAEERNDYQVRLWQTGVGSQVTLYPNLTSNDPVWKNLTRDVRFRRALSLAIDRQEINQVVYLGLAIPGNNTVLPSSPLFKPEFQQAWTDYDIDKANELLDAMELTQRDDRGIRLMPDGRPIDIIIQTAGEYTEQTDVLQLVHDSWVKIGVKLYSKPSQREVFRNRIYSGEAMMGIWSGVDNGVPSASMSPREFVPTDQDQYQWSQWGNYHVSGGHAGQAPDMPTAKRLLELNRQWENANRIEEKEKAWHEILGIHSQELFTIGIVSGVRQPIVVHKHLHNLPKEGIYSFAPTSYFGIYRPDTFWFDANAENQ